MGAFVGDGRIFLENMLTTGSNRLYSPVMSRQSFTTCALESKTAEELAVRLCESHGPYIRLAALAVVLGYASTDAARKAASRNQLPVKPVKLAARRGIYVSTVELADWLHAVTRRRKTPTDLLTMEEAPRPLTAQ